MTYTTWFAVVRNLIDYEVIARVREDDLALATFFHNELMHTPTITGYDHHAYYEVSPEDPEDV